MTHAALQAVGATVGEWQMHSPQFPGVGRMVIEWVDDGSYLKMSAMPPDPAPAATWLIGADDSDSELVVLYHDTRDVSRVYRMAVTQDGWRMWRTAPGFSQRLNLVAKGDEMRGTWERSADGTTWEHDFDLIYQRS